MDIFSNHFYPPSNEKLKREIAAVEAARKVYLAWEYDWTGKNPQVDSLQTFFDIIEDRQSTPAPVVAGDIFWSLFMHDLPIHCDVYVDHADGFTMHYGDPANTPLEKLEIDLITAHFSRMTGQAADQGFLPSECAYVN